jgi:hypothetical protein
MSLPNYDAYKLVSPYEGERDEPEEDEESCDECRTVQLADFVQPSEGVFVRKRCETCEEDESVGF